MSAAEFDERAFRARVNSALEKVRTILDLSRTPKPAGEVQHRYDDKFLVAENLVNSASAATLVALEALGVKPASVAQMREWARTRSVTIRLRADEKCTFLRKVEREVQSDTSSVFSNSILGVFKSFTTTKVTEFFWRFDPHYELVAFQGNDTDNAIVLLSRSGSIELKTSAESTPRPASVVLPNIDANITWLLLNTDNRGAGTLKVDRSDRQCRTPRRNAQVEAALNAARAFMPFVASTVSYLGDSWIKVDRDCTQPSKLEAMFVPVLPLLEVENGHAVTLSADPFGPFLAEQRRSLATLIEDLTKVTVNPKLVTVEELKLEAILFHVTMVLAALQEGLDYLEHLLYHQIITAIGKEVTSADFADYQRFHNRKLFKQQYQMRQFAYAIRRPGHAPEGTVTIDHQIRGDTLADPVYTSVSHAVAARPMKFAINAATHVHFRGDRFLHGLVLHKFSGDSESSMSLVARARQFSSFVVLLGAIAGADTFEPKYAFIVRNKDEMRIPLNSEALPTAKEFRDAIESTSPEQQRFAKAYRSMQMEATLFGICVIQIKPQMERLLHLGDDALTKETALTQRLMEMFITHQISPDMFSYDGPSEAGGAARIARVQHLVSHIEDMVIGKQIKKEQQQASQAQQLAAAQVDVPIASGSTEILYALVAHNHTVLVEAVSVHGNIPRVARLALTRLPSPRAPRLSYAYDNKYHFHFASYAPITVMCVTAADTNKRLCFGFLEDVRSSFVAKYDLATRSSAIELQMQSTFGRTLTERMEFWSHNPEDAQLAMVRRDMEGIKAIMTGIQQLVSEQSTQLDSIESIDRMLDRGSRLELLVDKTETLQEQSYKFKAQAVTLKKRTWGGGLLSSAISAIADATSTKEYAPLPPSPSPSPASVVATAATTEPPKPVQALQPEASSAPAVATDAPAANLAPAEKPPSKAVEKVVAPPAINEARTDYTQVPRDMERRLEEADAESAARPTTLTAGAKWERLRHKTLLSPAEKETLEKAEHEKERIKAFDLLDALTRSGELTIDCAELHVIVATTYCFDKSLMSTLVVDNVNPIERLERTAAVVASVVHNAPPAELVSSEARDRMVATGAAHLLD